MTGLGVAVIYNIYLQSHGWNHQCGTRVLKVMICKHISNYEAGVWEIDY